MKKLIYSIIIALPIFLLAGCFDSDKTELGWINGDGSDATIQEIKWQNPTTLENDQEWNEPLAKGSQTELKEINETNGRLRCEIDDGTEFVNAEGIVINGGSDSLQLEPGSSGRYEVVVTTAKKK